MKTWLKFIAIVLVMWIGFFIPHVYHITNLDNVWWGWPWLITIMLVEIALMISILTVD
jgi:hypothetical protein